MPAYDYRCDRPECDGYVFEIVKSIKDSDRPEPCPKCGGETVRHFAGSAPPVHFKGAGWYTNAYGKGKNPGNK